MKKKKQHLWGGMSTLNSKNFMHHPTGALGKFLWKLEGLGYPLGGTFPADANTEGVRGEGKLLDGLITTLIIRSNCTDYSSSSICLCMHAWDAKNAALTLSLDKGEKNAYILKQSDFKAITKSNNSLGKRVIVHCFAIFKVTRHHIVRTDGRAGLRFYFNTLWSREIQEISD